MKTIKFANENGRALEVLYAIVLDENHDALLAEISESGRHTKSGLPINTWMLKPLAQQYGAKFLSAEQYAEYQKQTLGQERPATAKQISYLKLLGHTHNTGLTVRTASELIDSLKNYRSGNQSQDNGDDSPVIWDDAPYGDNEG